MTTETQTFQAPVFSAQGKQGGTRQLPEGMFDGTVNVPVMHQAVKAFLANRRQGTAKTKTRGEVTGGNQKPWKQKGTGRARQGSTRAPNWPGGGTVFGPQPRKYTQIVPKQVRALSYSVPKTKAMLSLFASLGVAGKKVLLLTDGVKPNVYLSARNVAHAHVMPFSDVSTYHILWSDVVVIESSALTQSSAEA
jgi:large subunit ribosomal protein L4